MLQKRTGPSGVVADMFQAAGDAGVRWISGITDVCNRVMKEGRISEDWCKSWMVNVYMGKGDAIDSNAVRIGASVCWSMH